MKIEITEDQGLFFIGFMKDDGTKVGYVELRGSDMTLAYIIGRGLQYEAAYESAQQWVSK